MTLENLSKQQRKYFYPQSFLPALLSDGIEYETDILNNLRYGIIVDSNGKRYITYIDCKTMKAYEMYGNHYYNGLLFPLQEIKEYTFIRWCTSMDV